MIGFQPGWDSINWFQEVKSKITFFSEIPKYLRKENTWLFFTFTEAYLYAKVGLI